jgi:two-component system sensor histidine kinase BaeS
MVVAVGVTLVLAVVLVRRSVQHEALKSLARQAALIAAQQRAVPRAKPLSTLGVFFNTQQERLAILSLPQAALLLPPAGGDALRAGRAAQGSVTVSGSHYLYAARPEAQQAIVLLRDAKLAASDTQPFTVAFAIAAAVGLALAAVASFLLSGAVVRPIRRVALASQRLAAGEPHGPLPVTGSDEVAALAVAFNQMAEDLQRTKEAEQSFLLSVSHELKTPLSSIRGHGEALLDGVLDVPTAARVVVSESKRLDRLVRDLLDLGRLNQRSFAVTLQPVDLSQIVQDALSRHEATSLDVGVELVGHTDGPALVSADPDRVLQVLSNLIENAVRSTPAGGSVSVSAGPGVVTVADTGPGLAAGDLPRAFERFFLYSRYAAHRAVGTGLGLAIVKELTEAMGGSVTVESVLGKGTAFTVRLSPLQSDSRPDGLGRG